MNTNLKFRLSILAGISISFGCSVFLLVGQVVGAILFAFGLLACVHFKFPLYTGTAGFIYNKQDLEHLVVILLGNILGCLVASSLLSYAIPSLQELVAPILSKRMLITPFQSLILSICCGFIMTIAVKFGRENKFLPLLFGVPLFILCGFIHSIADAFYLTIGYCQNLNSTLFLNYVVAIAGNFIGCNLYRIVTMKKDYLD